MARFSRQFFRKRNKFAYSLLWLLTHQAKTNEITIAWSMFEYPILISIDFDDFTSPFTP